MRITNAYDLGRYVRDQRRAAGLTQTELADRAGVSRRWLSDLEAGKATAEIGLVLKAVVALGLAVDVQPDTPPEFDLDENLDNLARR